MVASINSRTGRSVMMRVDCRLMVDVPEAGETRLADVYALGAQKCRGMLAERTINTLLGLNIGTYVALDVTNLPQLVDAIDTVSMELTAEEAAALGLEEGWNDLEGEELGLPVQLLWVALAVPVTALGASLYQTADLGIAPYDYLSLGLRDYTPVPYFGCRVFTDALCALLCWLLGGLVGIGTLICAFCLGPFIQFFNGLVSERVLHYKPGGQ